MIPNQNKIKSKILDDENDANNERNSSFDCFGRIMQLYTHNVSFFINKNKKFMKELEHIYQNLIPKLSEMKNRLDKNDMAFRLIMKSFQNIKNYSYDLNKKTFTKDEKKFMSNNGKAVLQAIDTFFSFFLNDSVKNKSKVIENLLFRLVFNPTKDGSNTTSIYSVYQIHDLFIYTNSSFVNFKSSTGSGKTRCAPFFFAIRMIEENLEKPFFIMTQPSYSIISDKYKDFKTILRSTVTLIKDSKELFSLYKKYTRLVEDNKTKTMAYRKFFSKPIIGLLSPHALLSLLSKTDKNNIDIISYTRFCIDESHQRNVDTDVLIATLSEKMNIMVKNKTNFPLQLMMMSATPDPRILKCFINVDIISLPDSQLFPIKEIKVEVESKSNVNSEVISKTFDVITQMATNELDKGHILIFTSGNSRIADIHNQILSNCERQCKNDYTIIKVIKNFDMMIKGGKVQQFYNLLDKYINQQKKLVPKNQDILFILPIKYLGYVSDEQKEIGKNVIPKHNNVVKIIIATNAIESSITINNLAAVIDSCLFNKPYYDKDNGLTTLVENPISVRSQTQRKGRVGRVRSGIYVQIMIKNNSLIDLLPPDIQVTDITLNILSLKSIGFDLEKINNLPDKVDNANMDKYITELTSFGALDSKTHEITPIGKLLGSFSIVSPFIVSAILKVAGYNIDEINDKNEDQTKIIRVLLGFLISLIFADSKLCINPYSQYLQKNYDQESDITTILMTFLDLMLKRRREIKEISEEYGFNSKNVILIISYIIQTAENLPYFKKQAKEEMRKKEEEEKKDEEKIVENKEENENINDSENDNKIIDVENIEDNSKKKKRKNQLDPNILSFKTIFRHLHKYATELRSNHQLNEFITSLIHEIGINKPEWLKCRIVKFMNIENIYSNPSIIYAADQSLSFENGKSSMISMKMRPGTFGLDCPVTGYILNIEHEQNTQTNYGSLVHFDSSLPMANSIIHPTSIQCPILLDNDFANPLIEGYLSEVEDNFKKFCRGNCTGNEDGNVLFFRSQGVFEEQEKNQVGTILTFIPKTEKAYQFFENALKAIEKFIPYTPSTILVPDFFLKCFVSIKGYGSNKTYSSVHLFKSNDFYPYQINHDSINYVIENFQKLKNPNGQIKFCITGENLSYSLFTNSTDKEERQNMKNSFPHVNPNCTSVFSNDKNFYSHLVILSSEKIQASGKINELTWINGEISDEYSNDEMIIHAANSLSRELISIKNAGVCFIFTLPDSLLNTIEDGVTKNQEKKIIGQIIDSYADNYINGTSLTMSINRKFHKFYYNGNKFKSEIEFIEAESKKQLRTVEEINEEKKSINIQIGILKNLKAQLYSQRNDQHIDQKINKTEYMEAKNKLTTLTERLEELELELMESNLFESMRKSSSHKLDNLKNIDKIKFRDLGDGCICIESHSSNPDEVKNEALNTIRAAYPNVEVETVFPYQILVKHRSYSKLNKNEFSRIVYSVANKFGAVVSRVDKYKESNNVNRQIKGTMSVYMYSAKFTLPFSGMIKSELEIGSMYSLLPIPRTIADPYILYDKNVQDVLKKWFSLNKLQIQQNGSQWLGEENTVQRALQLMHENPPKIPYNSYQLPTDINIHVISNAISRYRKSITGKLYFNRSTKTLFIPSSIPEKQIQTFIENLRPKNYNANIQNATDEDVYGIDPILGDVEMCEEDAELSKNYLNIFLKDGKILQKNYCVSCVKNMFSNNLRKMFNESQNEIFMDEIINDYENLGMISMLESCDSDEKTQDVFPFIPFGQMFWSFINEEKLMNISRAWITITSIKEIRKHQNFTFCPFHPSTLIPKNSNYADCHCIFPGCNFCLCHECNEWHKIDQCTKKPVLPEGTRRCPFCQKLIVKECYCNHIHCICGGDFCYFCGKGFANSDECYNHMTKDDHWKEAPDYLHYIKKNQVQMDILNKFYEEYPQYKPG